MPKTEKVLYVCKRCGAVGSIKQPHCTLCGGTFDQSMQLRPGEKIIKADRSERVLPIAAERKLAVTLLGILAAAFGIASALSLMLPLVSTGMVSGMVAVVLAIVAFAKKKGGKSLSLIGIVLGGYSVFVNIFYFLWKYIYLFID